MSRENDGAPHAPAGPQSAGVSQGAGERKRPQAASLAAAFIAAEGLLEPGASVLAAFSGGPDSTALAAILRSLGYRVTLGHVDHAMRPGSARDTEHCRAVAAALGLRIEATRLDPPPSGEAAARAARYRALEAMRVRVGAGAVATGHTLDDDAETVLLRQARGGFPLGIPPRRDQVVRPLLTVRRAETAAYCAERGLPVLSDPSNADESFARNRIRRRVLPGLGDAGIQALADLGARSRRAVAARSAQLDGVLAELSRNPTGSGEIRLDRAALGDLGGDLQRAVVRRFLGEMGIDVSGRLVHDLCSKLLSRREGAIDLPGGYVARSEPAGIVVARPAPQWHPPPIPLAVPGRTPLPAWGLEAVVERLAPPPSMAELRAGAAAGGPDAGWRAAFDAGAVGSQGLALRSRRPGDRYRPLGAPGQRKLQDLFVDAKIPRAERDRVPVVTCAGGVAWVAGFRIDERYRLTPSSVAAIALTLTPTEPDPRPAPDPRP